MKKLFITLLFLGSGAMLFAQNTHQNQNQNRHDNGAPTPVQRSFQKDYPGNNTAQWQQQQNNQWHAVVKDKDNRDVDVYYDHNGHKLSTHSSWDRKNVPSALDKRINSRYHSKDYQVHRIERPNLKPLFQITLTIGGKNKTVYMDDKGNEQKYNHNY
jgi:hypothetical protein